MAENQDVTRISPESERKLTDAVRRSITLVNDGATPDDAVAKIAAEMNYNPDYTSRMVEMFNTSRTLAHFKQASTEDRSVDFPTANIEAVTEIMYPTPAEVKPVETVKAASLNLMSIKSDHKPQFEKAANCPHDGDAVVKKGYDALGDLTRDENTKKTDLAQATERRNGLIRKAAMYFRQSGHLPFSTVDTRVKSHHEKMGSLVMDAIWEGLGSYQVREKRGSDSSRRLICDTSEQPYGLIQEIIDTCHDVAEKQATLGAATEKKASFEKDMKAKFGEIAGKEDKTAAVLPFNMTYALSSAVGNMMSRAATKKEDQVRSAIGEMTDPVHQSQLRAIRTEAMLHDIMANDPVIAKYDPADVIDAFNSISQMAPRSAIQPTVMRGYLRRMLEGSDVLEPFEVKQLAETEEKMKPAVISDPKNIITPESVMGTSLKG